MKPNHYVERFYIFGEEIEESPALTLLGVKIGANASLADHCKARAVSANQRINLLRLISGRGWGANPQILEQLYIQYIRPVLEHGAVVTANALDSHLKPLVLAEHKALRAILGAPRWTRISDLYEAIGLEPLTDRLATLRQKAILRFGDSEAIRQTMKMLEIISG